MSYRQWVISESELSEHQRAGLEYWRTLPTHDDSGMPLVSDFDLMRIAPAVLPTTHIVDVLEGGAEFRYRFWGSRFRDYLGYDGTGRSTKDLIPAEIREPVRQAYAAVVKAREPLCMLSEFARGGSSARQGFQRFIRLPLAARDGSVAQVVSLVEFMMAEDDARTLIDNVTDKDC